MQQAAVDATPIPQGLTDAEVAERVGEGRVNRAPGGTSRSMWDIVRANVFTRFNAILGTLLVVILTIGPLQDALFGVVLVTNTGIGIYQEWRAKRTLDRSRCSRPPPSPWPATATPRDHPWRTWSTTTSWSWGRGPRSWPMARCSRRTPSRSTSRCCPASPCPRPRRRATRCCRAASSPPDRAGTAPTASAPSPTPTSWPRRPVGSRWCAPELRSGTDRILKFVTWLIIPIAILLIFSQLAESTDDSVGDAIRGTVAGVGSMIPEGLVLLTSIAFTAGVLRLGRRQVLVQELPPSRAWPASTSVHRQDGHDHGAQPPGRRHPRPRRRRCP